MNATALAALLDVGLETDKATTATAIQMMANTVERAEADHRPLPADLLRMIHMVFQPTLRHIFERSKVTTNVICMQLMELGLTSAGMSYILARPTIRMTTTLESGDLSRIALQEAGS